MFFPISDKNDVRYRFKLRSFVNIGFILLSVLVFAHEARLGAENPEGLKLFMNTWAFNPKDYLGDGYLKLSYPSRFLALCVLLANLPNLALVKMLASTFIHGNLMHLFGNMLGLWMLGDNVEYAMGHIRYFLFFVITAVLAFMGQALFLTAANFEGAIGASGAIFAVAGAYLAYFPKARINFFYFFIIFFGVTSFPARIVIALFFIGQVLTSYSSFGSDYGMIAVWAHVSGFMAGFLLSFLFRRTPENGEAFQPATRDNYRRNTGPWGKRD